RHRGRQRLPGGPTGRWVRCPPDAGPVRLPGPHDVLVDAAAIQSAPPLTSASFVPRGGTQLYDAMGHIIADATIRAERRRIENEPEEAHPTKIRWRGPTAGQTASRRCNCSRGHAE